LLGFIPKTRRFAQMMNLRKTKRALMMVGVFAIFTVIAGMAPVGAAGSGSRLRHDLPTWWAKLQKLSSPRFSIARHRRAVTAAGNVTVGPNIDVSKEKGPQSETFIAIDPTDTSRLVAGSNEIDRLPMRAYFSNNGGTSWGGVDLPLPPPLTRNGFDFGSDPGVAWDTLGNVYYSYIVVFFSKGGAVNGSEMAVARSSDGGHTWRSTYFNMHRGGAKFNDKPFITVDTNPDSPFYNDVYVAWDTINGTNGVPSTTGILVSRSTDHGRTFSTPVFASDTLGGPRFGIGADPFVGPDGTLYVAWHDFIANAIVVSASTDGGRSFGPTHTIAPTVIPFATIVPPQASRGVLVYPACEADTGSGARSGTLYCSWMDGDSRGDTDIFEAHSSNHATSWSDRQRVNDDFGVNYQFNQWLAVDPADGSVNISWNDSRLDPNDVSTNVFFARSTDGAASFAPNIRVTTAPTNETCCGADLGNQYGDYEGIDAIGGHIHPVWTDRRLAVRRLGLGEEVFTTELTPR
jgi:hypothetical protein